MSWLTMSLITIVWQEWDRDRDENEDPKCPLNDDDGAHLYTHLFKCKIGLTGSLYFCFVSKL